MDKKPLLVCRWAALLLLALPPTDGVLLSRDAPTAAASSALIEQGGRDPLCPSNCSGHGHCHEATATCTCLDGWLGTDCSMEPIGAAASCPNNCSMHGWCVRGSCLCDELYTGHDCSTLSTGCPNGCSGFGFCDKGRRCVCDALHTGRDCSLPAMRRSQCPGWPSAPCGGLDRGVCDLYTGLCTCTPEWRGSGCEASTAPRPCRSANCSGHGTCDHETGTCVCDADRTGRSCERAAGTLSVGELLLVIVTTILLLGGAGVLALVLHCARTRGVAWRDTLSGRWQVRKTEGWHMADSSTVRGIIPGARFEQWQE